MTRRAARWLASNGVCRGMMILMHHAFSLAGRGRFGWKAPTPSGTGGGNGRCRRRRSTTSQDIASWCPSTHSNGGFDMIRLRILRLRPVSLSRGRRLDERPQKYPSIIMPVGSPRPRWPASSEDSGSPSRVTQRCRKGCWRSLFWRRASGHFGTHINKKITQKNHFGRRSLDETSGFWAGSVLGSGCGLTGPSHGPELVG
ncbi:hypothetical protein CH063_05715 [Colletotrichum higginsianum]|uniref:Uncharacterized protein n=1 Tax=Colletotrichum higginsianum (strain IMI 349063) TaxID=759273 RepID=H1V001_COLHI|nr:hypothetical protein CH063_05715 [Colletotrichum higginsianum]